jgi:hypothetical protein
MTLPVADGVTQVTLSVANSLWMVPGQYIAVPGLLAGAVAVLQVVSKPSGVSVICVYPAFVTNTHAGDVITAGTGVSPGGSGVALTLPVSVANGGMGAATKAAAQTALGLGQDAVSSPGSSLAQTLTTGFLQVGTVACVIPAQGTWLLQALLTVDYAGVTAVAQTVTITIRNATQAVNLLTYTRLIGNITTQTYPWMDWLTPFVSTSGINVNDSIQIFVQLSAGLGAGTVKVQSATLIAIPLRKS